MEQIKAALSSAGAVDLSELCIDKGHGWAVFLDIYVLDADGALLDTCLLAAVAALLALRLPRVEVNDQGQVKACPVCFNPCLPAPNQIEILASRPLSAWSSSRDILQRSLLPIYRPVR